RAFPGASLRRSAQDGRGGLSMAATAAHVWLATAVVSAAGICADFAWLLAAAADAGALRCQPRAAHPKGPGGDECQADGGRRRYHGGDRYEDHPGDSPGRA